MRLRLVVGFVATAATMLTPVAFTATSSAAPSQTSPSATTAPTPAMTAGPTKRSPIANSATDPAPDNVANDGDVDSNDGGNRRQGNEPTIAIDPTNPDVIVAGWNDYCMTDLAAGWMGWASRPTAAARARLGTPRLPARRLRRGDGLAAQGPHRLGDPLVAFDNDGRLFVGGISFNRVMPQDGSVFVATYEADAGPSGPTGQLPKDYVRTRIIGKAGVPAFAGIFQDKPLMEVDRSTASPHEDNVYFCWTKFQGNGRTKIYFSRSTDHGATFERSEIVSDGSVQGCDIAVEHDGDVYVSWHSFPGIAQEREGMKVVRSTDGGLTFSKPRQIATFTAYFPNIGKSRLRDGRSCVPHRASSSRGSAGAKAHRRPVRCRGWCLRDVERGRPGHHRAERQCVQLCGGWPGRALLVYVAKSVDDGIELVGRRPRGPVDGRPGPPVLQRCRRLFRPARGHGRTTGPTTTTRSSCHSATGWTPRTGPFLGTDVVGSYAATSTDGVTWTPLGMVSTTTHQPSYEMFGNRDIPFQGDYNWVAIADANGPAAGGRFAYAAWTDNRQVVPGRTPGDGGAGRVRGRLRRPAVPDRPRRRRGSRQPRSHSRGRTPLTGDNCGNGGGLDQDIFGTRIALD